MTFIVKCAPVLKEWRFCCCSCSLRAAAIVLAWIGMITNITNIVTFIIYLSHPTSLPQTLYETKEYSVGMLGSTVGTTILHVLLLYGIHNKKPVYMLPFLVLDLIGVVMLVALVFIGGTIVTVNNWEVGLIVYVIGFAVVVLSAFYWVVLYSYYRQIEEEKNPNSGVVDHTNGIPNDQIQVLPEDEKFFSPYPHKVV